MTMTHPGAGRRGRRSVEKAALHHEIKAQRRAVLIVNTLSRRVARFYAHAKAGPIAAGLTRDATCPVRHAERVHEVAREAIAHGHRFIIVGGGDGSISSVDVAVDGEVLTQTPIERSRSGAMRC
jgi:hypothetical protein